MQDGGTVVVTPERDRDDTLADVLDVLHTCVDEHGVESVRVDVDGWMYSVRADCVAAVRGRS